MQVELDDFGPVFVTANQVQSWLSGSRRVRSADSPPRDAALVIADQTSPPGAERSGPVGSVMPASPGARDAASSSEESPAPPRLRARSPARPFLRTHSIVAALIM